MVAMCKLRPQNKMSYVFLNIFATFAVILCAFAVKKTQGRKDFTQGARMVKKKFCIFAACLKIFKKMNKGESLIAYEYHARTAYRHTGF